MNLYQRHSPLALTEILSHQRIVKEIQDRAIKKDFPSASYFSGPSGVGKTALARILAKYILCENPREKGEPCLECETCKGIHEQQELYNYFEVNASDYGKDEVSALIEKALVKNIFTKNQKRVFFVNEFQDIKSKPAEKNLLMILERPIPDTYWILASMDDSKVEPAIRNRCVVYNLLKLEPKEIAKGLIAIAKRENCKEMREELLTAIGMFSNGSMRQAISYLERMIYSNLWSEELIIKELGIVPNDPLNKMLERLCRGDFFLLENKVSEETLRQMFSRLLLAFKYKCGVILNRYELSMISFSDKLDKEVILNTIRMFREIFKAPFLNETVIESFLLEILDRNKK